MTRVKLKISSSFRDKLLVSTLFHYVTILKYYNLIYVLNSGQSMSNDDTGSTCSCSI